jgi:hypothetical protein
MVVDQWYAKCFETQPMSMAMQHENDNIYRLEIRGILRKEELDRCQNSLADEIRRVGSVRLLFVLDGFEGWDRQDSWNDLTFFVRYGDKIDRIAIIGEERWRSEALMFAGADLRRGPVEFFLPGFVKDARTWLSS